ncbi:MAG: NAD(P)/FAD-dependent oxidoreductase [Deltaproteobacteria bacterium]|nr:NAD(P)/FAD-dependent oxidoreductase [Deltaproteobacteria bacterium]
MEESPLKDHYDVVIIGGGIGGMACAMYLSERGRSVLVVEKNQQPMGSAWAKTVKGYTFEETIHYMASMDEHGPTGRFFTDLRRHREVETVFMDDLYRLVGRDYDVRVNTNVEAFRRSLLEMAPEDASFINWFVDETVHFARNLRWPTRPYRWMGLSGRLSLLWPFRGHVLSMLKLRRTPFHAGVMKWIKNPRLRNLIYSTLHGSDFSFLADVAILGSAFTASGGLPLKGVQHLFQTLEDVITSLGGEVACMTRVDRILTHHSRATGVRLSDGSEITSSAVVSAIDRAETYENLLANDPLIQKEKARFASYPLGLSFNTVSVGVSLPTSLDSIGAHHVRLNDQSSPIHDRDQAEEDKVLSIRFCHFANPDAAPEGHSAIVLSTISHFDDWAPFLRPDGTYGSASYYNRKDEIADLMLERCEKIVPLLRSHVEHRDMSTPLTILKWTAARRGIGSGGYYATPSMISRILSEESRISDLYCCGQFATGRQGINGALQSARNTAALILDDRRMLDT